MRIKRIEVWMTGALAAALVCGAAQAQKKPKDNLSGYDRSARATVVHPAIVYVTADDNAAHISEVLPGHEVVVIERNGAWVRVFANTDKPDQQDDHETPEFSADDTVTPASGWVRDKGLLTPATPNGDEIMFGMGSYLELRVPLGEFTPAHLLNEFAGLSRSELSIPISSRLHPA